MNLTIAAVGNLIEDLVRLCDDLEVTHRGTQWRVYVGIDGHGAQTFKTMPDVIPPDDTLMRLLECLVDALGWVERMRR